MSARNSLLLISAVVLSTVAMQAQQHHSIGGSAPVGITGPAPVGAVGPAPLGGVGSLVGARSGGRAGNFGSGGFIVGERRSGGAVPYRYEGRHGDRNRGSLYGDYRNGFYGLYGGPYYVPSLLDEPFVDSEGPGPETAIDPAVQNQMVQEDALGQQLEQLNEKLDELNANRQAPEPPSAAASGQASVDAIPPTPPVTVVMRNGQQLQVANFAVMNGVFWDFSKGVPRRIPIANIDVAASVKATENSGGEFPQLNP